MPEKFRAALISILLAWCCMATANAQTAPALCDQAQCDALAAKKFFCPLSAPFACVGTLAFGGCNASSTFWNQQNCGGPACDTNACPWNANAPHGNPPAADRTLTLDNQCPFAVLAGFTGGGFKFADGSQLTCSQANPCPSGLTCDGGTGTCFWTLPGNKIRYPLAAGKSAQVKLSNPVLGNKDPNAEQFIKWSGNVWAATGCTSTAGVDCASAPCPTGGCTPSTGPLGPRTAAEFTLLNNGQDYYDVSTIDGTNVPVVMAPSSGQSFALTPFGADGQYYCSNPGGTSSSSSQLKGCGWTVGTSVAGKDESLLMRMVEPKAASAKACTSDSNCTAPEVCGQHLDPTASDPSTALSQVCGVQVAWLNANGICKATGEKGKVGSVDCTAIVTGSLDRADLYGCAAGIYANSCYSDGATKACCGCEDWPGIVTTSKCVAANKDWMTLAEPWARVFKDACATAYSYPFDDKTSTFTCRTALSSFNPPSANAVNYTITFCPGGTTGGVSAP